MEDILENLKTFKFELDEKTLLEQKELFSTEACIRNSTIIECPNCGVKGNEPNMYRWHFENCQTVFKNCKQCNRVIPRQGIKPFIYDKKNYCNRKCYMESKKGKPFLVMTDEIKEKLSKSWIGRDTTNYKKPKKKK